MELSAIFVFLCRRLQVQGSEVQGSEVQGSEVQGSEVQGCFFNRY